MRAEIVVIGGGLVGLAAARALAGRHRGARVTVLEKESHVAMHQSGHNSGVLHAGLDYVPGSAKARLAVRGIHRMVAFCNEHGIRYERCGKLVVAADATEALRLRAMLERGTANGVSGLRLLTETEAREIEPHVRCVAALQVPQEGIVDYASVASALGDEVRLLGGEVRTGTCFISAHRVGPGWRLVTSAEELHADLVINCAGLHADRVARAMGENGVPKIVPFRGDYFRLRPRREHLVRNLIYPVPDPAFPFLGVHFTRMVGGGVECGPSAVLALKREGYRRHDFLLRDAVDSVTYPGVWRFVGSHAQMVAAELWRAVSKSAFARALQRLVPEVDLNDLEPGGAGVRAQAMMPNGRLVDDFLFKQGPAALHVLNAPSPGATASLVIGEHIADRASSLAPDTLLLTG